MSDTVKQAGIKQADGTYLMKDIGVDYTNVDGLATAATAFKAKSADKATADKNNKDITEYIASGSKSDENLVLTKGDGTSSNVDLSMTGATPTTNGIAGFVPQPTTADNDKFLKGDGTWGEPDVQTYQGSDNIEIDSSDNSIDLKDSTVTSGTYGPSADVTGSNGVAILVPKFTVDAKGRLTSAGTQTYTSVDTTYRAGTGLSLSGTSFSLGSHASTGTGYGQGSGSNFGHVKLNDTYASLVSGADAAGGVAASQNALYNAYNTLNERLNEDVVNFFDIVRPVGSLYSTTDATFNPNTAKGWHGTWERIKDCVIYASGDSDTVGQIVGNNTHTLTTSELPSHTHSIPALSGTAASAGAHTHSVVSGPMGYGTDWAPGQNAWTASSTFQTNYFLKGTAGSNGAHTHTVTTNASTTGSQGSGTAIDMRPRRLNSVVWRRTA